MRCSNMRDEMRWINSRINMKDSSEDIGFEIGRASCRERVSSPV